MRTHLNPALSSTVFALLLAPAGAAVAEEGSADAADTAGAPAPTGAEGKAEEAEEGGLGLNIDLGFATAYLWRGANLFMTEAQGDQNMMLAPGVTYTLGESGLWVGWWSAWQVSGSGIQEYIDAGTGAEQDLMVGYSHELSDSLGLAAGLTWYFYPLAEKEAAGTSTPSYLEPNVGLRWAGPLELGLTVAYYHGLQEELSAYRHLYLNPSAGRSFALGERVELQTNLGFGYKVFNEGEVEDNIYDVLLKVALPISLPADLYATPSLLLAWTNLGGSDFADELSYALGINVGADL
ncbi:MAG: hypothetical protein FJ125_07140 [Deltaproteobacteria bacterium]|nr:hypothetical protein [Deltaproteobacteria bacterium]